MAGRKVVGWAMSDTLKAVDTTVAAWRMALKNRAISSHLIFHSDQGVQYACAAFRDELKDLPVEQSMTGPPGDRKENCRGGGPLG
ncbi:DDE-type integrase/transposase/recombinase [Fibrisoma limi]|uniref:DDE-type integrase/transposase/recombinase n=1 Tax=Fibrisoma limi TaxID=663275 RepID=UPI0035B615FE